MAKILVVSADLDARELIVFALRFAGHQLKSVSNVEECVEQKRLFNPNLILLESTLPVVNEMEADRYLKSHEITAGVPLFIFKSNRVAEGVSEDGKRDGDDLVLNRISPDQFTDRVNSILRRLQK